MRLSLVAALLLATIAADSSAAPQPQGLIVSGENDFSWEVGTWTSNVRVRRNPLSGEGPKWAEYVGTSVIKPLLDGRANFVELSVAGAAGKIEGGSLRLYNPHSGQWSLNFASVSNGLLTAPVYGRLSGNRGFSMART